MKQRSPISYTEMLATQRTPPTFDIGAMRYFVDVDMGLLREKDNRERLIYFSEMEDAGSHYKLTLQNGQTVDVPYMIQLDPEAVADKYGVKVSELPAKDSELKCPPELLADRLQGKLPTLSLCGHTFYVDLRQQLLRPKDDFSTMGIATNSLPSDYHGNFYSFLYNPATHEQVQAGGIWKKIPKGVVAVEIPHDAILDPVYVIWKHSSTFRKIYPMGDREQAMAFDWNSVGGRPLIDRFPVRYNHEARIIPWEQTIYASLMKDKMAKGPQKNVQVKGKKKGL